MLSDEIEFFWCRKVNTVMILYFGSRYLSLFGNIPVILHYFGNWTPIVCSFVLCLEMSLTSFFSRPAKAYVHSVSFQVTSRWNQITFVRCRSFEKYFELLLVVEQVLIGSESLHSTAQFYNPQSRILSIQWSSPFVLMLCLNEAERSCYSLPLL